MNPQHPWAAGPGEILRHGLSLLKNDSDVNRRLAMILIDNSVELMIKTYLGLPKRISGLMISRRDYQEISESFPRMLDALETHGSDKLDGIDLGTIEWYHRLRNELYHQGNGLTVERDKVEVYAELANLLFKNLFGIELVDHVTPAADILGEFIEAWSQLESGLSNSASMHTTVGTGPRTVLDASRFLQGAGVLSTEQVVEIDSLRRTRNEVVHGTTDYKLVLTPAIVSRVRELAKTLDRKT